MTWSKAPKKSVVLLKVNKIGQGFTPTHNMLIMYCHQLNNHVTCLDELMGHLVKIHLDSHLNCHVIDWRKFFQTNLEKNFI